MPPTTRSIAAPPNSVTTNILNRGSAIKLFYSELYQRIADLGLRALGRDALCRHGDAAEEILTRAMHSLSLTIAAGTSQIQRNIIGERILGLPRER